MHGAIVTLDIETTGLDPQRDHIIEIGAVRSENGSETAVFQAFVNPGIPIPSFITNLTGIRDEDVAGAPAAAEVLPEFADFVGDRPVLAHNARFDLSFLQAGGILQDNLALDTVGLATLLLPQAQRYSLSALAETLGIELTNAHRALEDARATSELYWVLWEKACTLPAEVKSEILRDSEPFAWNLLAFFRAACAENDGVTLAESTATNRMQPRVLPQADFAGHPALIDALLSCLHRRESCFLETGAIPHVGESSLLAAMQWSQRRRETVILAVPEEEQLAQLRSRAQQLASEHDFAWAVMSAPQDHLCSPAWAAMRAFPPLDLAELRFRIRILVWLAEGGQGERKELTIRGSLENNLWRRICGEQCRCSDSAPCQWHKAQQETAGNQVTLTTSACLSQLLQKRLGGRAMRGPVLVLAATQVEESLSESETSAVSLADIERSLHTLLDDRVGWLAELEKTGAREEYLKILRSSIRTVFLKAREMFSQWEQLWAGTEGSWLNLHDAPRRENNSPSAFATCQQFCEQGEELVLALDRLIRGLEEKADTATLSRWTRGLKEELRRSLVGLRRALAEDDAQEMAWLGRNARQAKVQLQAAPLRPGRKLMQTLTERGQTVLLQDSVFDVGDDGRFWQERLTQADLPLRSLQDPRPDAAKDRLFIPQDVPTPNERAAFQRALERSLIHIASTVEQRLITLFTSHSQLQEIAAAIQPRLGLGGIAVFERNQLAQFLAAQRGLLLIHWRDYNQQYFPVEKTTMGILVRLPFDLPDQPLVATRAAEYGDGFQSFSVPIAITRMLRLLRKTQAAAREQSAWVILDSRIIKKRYGEMFMNALPEIGLHYGESERVGPAIQQWLNRAAP
ncbi:MAG: exonuclease domain-containing protein [Anaerolineaceae bacterium]|nr:exonuclease domain-containing protein [Anaerolineaceae bacterium]